MSLMLREVLLNDISAVMTPASGVEFGAWVEGLSQPWVMTLLLLSLIVTWHFFFRPWTEEGSHGNDSWGVIRIRVITICAIVLLVMLAELVPLKPQNGTDLRPVCQGLLVLSGLAGPARLFLVRGVASVLLRLNEPSALCAIPTLLATLFSAIQTFFPETSLLAHVRGLPSLWVLAAFLSLFGVLSDTLHGDRVPVRLLLGPVLLLSLGLGLYWGLFWSSGIKALMTSAAIIATMTPAAFCLARIPSWLVVLGGAIPYVICGFFVGQEGNLPLWGIHLVWPSIIFGLAFFWVQVRRFSGDQ